MCSLDENRCKVLAELKINICFILHDCRSYSVSRQFLLQQTQPKQKKKKKKKRGRNYSKCLGMAILYFLGKVQVGRLEESNYLI